MSSSLSTKFDFSIDRGGTFTDVYCLLPADPDTGVRQEVVLKLLSVDPAYADAPTEGIRRVLSKYAPADQVFSSPSNQKLNSSLLSSVRMGTTVATNALLERQGERTVLVTTQGFGDLLEIRDQARKDIFDLTVAGDEVLYERVVEVDERVRLWKEEAGSAPATEDDNVFTSPLTGELVQVLRRPDLDRVRADLRAAYDAGVRAVAVCLLHSFCYDEHERLVAQVARDLGFTQVSLSSQVMPMVKLVKRGDTCCAAAYLTPAIVKYVAGFVRGFDDDLLTNTRLVFMKSDGGLAPVDSFGGHQAILSGPAGGVVGYARTTTNTTTDSSPVIGFDMGGTSTDVSRCAADGTCEHTYETTVAGVCVQAPQLDVRTVAAGGGSVLAYDVGRLRVGPQSAGARPGPVCYGNDGGILAVTDANVVLGRVLPEYFPSIFGESEQEPLNVTKSRAAFEVLRSSHESLSKDTIEQLAYGFLRVANESMCRPIRNLTQFRGYDVRTHVLACFGGAGPQHACAMAKNLGIARVRVHRHGGILSAYGLSLADAVEERQEPAADVWSDELNYERRLTVLGERAREVLRGQGYETGEIRLIKFLNMRYEGTDNAIMVRQSDDDSTYLQDFTQQYQREFGFTLSDRAVHIDDYRVRAVVPGHRPVTRTSDSAVVGQGDDEAPPTRGTTRAYFEHGWQEVNVYDMSQLLPGHTVVGPSIIVQSISTVVLEPHCTALVTPDGDLDIVIGRDDTTVIASTTTNTLTTTTNNNTPDPVLLSIFGHRFMGIAEQMGHVLARTAISVNIKERLDFSCALFTATGGLVANAPHIPVHLGAMQTAVAFQLAHWGLDNLAPGDVLVTNDPHEAGGSHLPDMTVITPVFARPDGGDLLFFVAGRGHHADVGGIVPGSMPPHSTTLEQEGCRIVAFKLVENGVFQEEGITKMLNDNPYRGTRNLRDNLADLKAQVAANQTGIRLLHELVEEHSLTTVQTYMRWVQEHAEHAVRDMLKSMCGSAPQKQLHALDYMDDGTPIELLITIDLATGDAVFDFTGTGPQVLGNWNAPRTVTYSAVIYSLRSLVNKDVPLNQGCLTPVTIIIPPDSLLWPQAGRAVVGGNVLTSQRVVDVVLKAFGACAASQGCMNNLTFGDDSFGYYETIAGGAGAGPTWHGRSGVQTHCTNTRMTDVEILERRYPILLHEFSLRRGSGGKGQYRGGDGVVREMEPLRPLTMNILSERRARAPYGMAGGEDGKRGKNLLKKKDGAVMSIGGRCSTQLDRGDRLRIETPGGGGYGSVVVVDE